MRGIHGCVLPTEPVFCPHVVLPQASLRVKAMLQHQPWNLEYSLDPNEYGQLSIIIIVVLAHIASPLRRLLLCRLYGSTMAHLQCTYTRVRVCMWCVVMRTAGLMM